MKSEIALLVRQNNLNSCLECGKCTAVCPMLDLYGEYVYERSPRGVVERLMFDPSDMEREEAFWYCLTCQECTFFCPVGVNFQRFMMELRELLLDSGQTGFALFCNVCGSYLMPKKEFEALQKGDSRGSLGELLSVCPRCKKNRVAEVLHRVAPRDKRVTGL